MSHVAYTMCYAVQCMCVALYFCLFLLHFCIYFFLFLLVSFAEDERHMQMHTHRTTHALPNRLSLLLYYIHTLLFGCFVAT